MILDLCYCTIGDAMAWIRFYFMQSSYLFLNKSPFIRSSKFYIKISDNFKLTMRSKDDEFFDLEHVQYLPMKT